jgi:hypothetical protein
MKKLDDPRLLKLEQAIADLRSFARATKPTPKSRTQKRLLYVTLLLTSEIERRFDEYLYDKEKL